MSEQHSIRSGYVYQVEWMPCNVAERQLFAQTAPDDQMLNKLRT